ncbi:MAG: hypothetical protein HFG34_09275 [Eubacterium sp.]|nr:hypothetical protein [Eubacterium sp.]
MRKKSLRNVLTKAVSIALSAMLLLQPVASVRAESQEANMTKTGSSEPYDSIDGLSGEILYDTDGNRVYACGGEVRQFEENGETKYYWYGVDDLNKGSGWQNNEPGIHLYSSSDLYNWKYEGVMYNETDEIYAHPKMLYNGDEYVMWVSTDKGNNDGMTLSGTVKVLSSKSITGPFTLVRETTSNGFINLYEEAPGTAYLIQSGDLSGITGSAGISKTKLSSDYKTTVGETQPLKFSSNSVMNTEGGIFKQNGKYYIVNAGMKEYASADSLDGTWTRYDLKMWDGKDTKEISSHNQTSNAFRVRTGNSDLWVCVGDSVNSGTEHRYIWLPFKFFNDGTIALWELSNWKIGDIEGVQPEEPGEPGSYDNIPGLSGRVLYDTDGRKIYACGGEVHEVEENGQKKWYWFGVDDLNREAMNEHPGVHLYSSTDLYNWDYEGVMLNKDGVTYAHPKILYNGEEYVMWVSYMSSGTEGGMPPTTSGGTKVVTSKSIKGPFTEVPNSGAGNNNGFINLYEESKGNAWLIYTDYSAASGSRIFRAKLKEDYTGIEGDPQPFQFSSGELSNAEGGIFERNGKYYMVNSGMKEYAVADSFEGEWKKNTLTMWDGTDHKDIQLPNQTSHVFHVKTQEADTYVCMGDSVGGYSAPSDPVCYIWLPIQFFDDGTIALKEERDWTIAGMKPQKPETTQKPEATQEPEATKAPEETMAPEQTQKPEATKTPEQTSKPEATKTPEQTSKPEATKTPEQTSKPEATKTPEQTSKPEATKTPEQTSKPEATPTPEQTSKPEATPTPEQTSKPEATPEQTLKPDTTNTPVETNKPAETGKPEETKRPIEVKSVLVASKKLTIGLGEKVQLEAAAYPRNASDRKLTYKASNKNVTVGRNGKITGKKQGTSKITISASNGKKAVVKVTVKKKPKKITLNARNKTLKIGKKFKIKVRLPKGTASQTLTYVSNKPAIADVSAEGKVTAKKSGSAVITVKTYNGKKASLKIKVK